MKVYNLEKFALEQIYRPFQNELGFSWKNRLMKLPFPLDETVMVFEANPKWARIVLDRIKHLKVTFPKYIKHVLLKALENKGKDE